MTVSLNDWLKSAWLIEHETSHSQLLDWLRNTHPELLTPTQD